MLEYPDLDFGHEWTQALAFRWGGNIHSTPAAHMAGSAYAKATNGIVFDCEQGKLLTPQDSLKMARDLLDEIPKMEEALRIVLEQINTDFSNPSGAGGTSR